jgi:hypothetical protein
MDPKDPATKVSLLRDQTVKLLDKALSEIRQAHPRAPRKMLARSYTAQYLLTEAKEYVEASWDLLKAGRSRASLCTSRWVLEAALNLLWVNAAGPAQVDSRLRLLEAEALRLDAARLEGLADMNPDPNQAKEYKALAATERDRLKRIVPKTGWPLKSLDFRIKSIMKYLQAKSMSNPYDWYRVCCAAAHPGLELWRRFCDAPGGAMVTSRPPDEVEVARRMAAAATVNLVGGAYTLTGKRDCTGLITLWKNKIVPLL